jgi:hypothetical protein
MPEPTKLNADNFILTVSFSNGQTRQIDVRKFFSDENSKVKEIKQSDLLFRTAKIEDGAAITWDNGFSVDPDVIYEEGISVHKLTGVSKNLIATLNKLSSK